MLNKRILNKLDNIGEIIKLIYGAICCFTNASNTPKNLKTQHFFAKNWQNNKNHMRHKNDNKHVVECDESKLPDTMYF